MHNGNLHLVVQGSLQTMEPGEHCTLWQHILSTTHPLHVAAIAEHLGDVAHKEPNVCLFILPVASVCGAEQHLIWLLRTWELTGPLEHKQAKQERGRKGKNNTFRCLGCGSQLLPTQESFVCPALDVTTTRSLLSQTLLVLKATTHTSETHLRRNA